VETRRVTGSLQKRSDPRIKRTIRKIIMDEISASADQSKKGERRIERNAPGSPVSNGWGPSIMWRIYRKVDGYVS
jgi:hypothetical protein